MNPPSAIPAATRRRFSRLFPLFLIGALYVAALFVISAANAAGPERWWWSTLNLYLPQWIWALPALGLAAATARVDRRWAGAPLLPLGWVLGPLMGLNGPGGQPVPPAASEIRLRLMTYNVGWLEKDPNAIIREINRTRPDLLLVQDAGGEFARILQGIYSEEQMRVTGDYLIASALPFSERDRGRASPFYQRCRIRVGASAVTVYNVHLLTPRAGLAALKQLRPTGSGELESNTAHRLHQAAALARDLRRERGPVLLAGDLNAPVQSLVCRQLFAVGLRDAFSVAGRGYGYTFGHSLRLRHSYVRLDHILASAHWQVRACRVGSASGSDHRPLIADVALRGAPDRIARAGALAHLDHASEKF